ncbi:hypothetical protein HZA97_08575 [Candidatus Woesearchaeota archaeon]|nr:hypothetical protein [Candidatus Woesearchaeota archaeon]
MVKKLPLTPKYISSDGKYLGVVSEEHFTNDQIAKFRFFDNKTEHAVSGKVVSSAKTKEGLHSFLVELEPPAPQRVIDMYYFVETHYFEVGEVGKEQLKLYINTVLSVGMPLDFDYSPSSLKTKIPIKGKVVLEEETGHFYGFKYAFWIKLDEELSQKEYETLKTFDRDDITNYLTDDDIPPIM